ncbi:MAG: tetratricopeptide repeat protein [Flavobacteriales bacterium]|nr:tetratricopeptide repeat protein [Flavobacteriales bacterium]
MSEEVQKQAAIEEIDRINAAGWELRATDMRKAYRRAKEAHDASLAHHYDQGLADSRRTLAIAGLSMGLHAESYEHAIAASRFYRDHGDMKNEAMVLNTLGAIYDYLNDYDNRLQANLRSLELRKLSGDHEGLLRSMNNTGDTYTRTGEYDKALALFEECLSMLDDSRPSMQAIVLSNIGEVYLLQGRDDEAIDKLQESLVIARRVNYIGIILADLLMLSRLANRHGRPQEAIDMLEDALKHIDENTGRNELAEIHLELSKAWAALGDPVKALEQHEIFYQHQEQHLNEKKIKEIRGMQFHHQISELQLTASKLEQLVTERTRELEKTLADLRQQEREKQQDLEVEQTVNQFSQTLFLQSTVEDVLWDLAKNCISRLGFEDSVIYLMDKDRQQLVQMAAYGPKNPIDLDILNPITIPIGKGIVGSVAQTGRPEVVADTSLDARYILDDEMRLSEIAVPIMSGKTVLGVIDSEHREKAFFSSKHLRILQTIASLVANRIDRIREQHERERLQGELIEQLRENEQLQTKVTRELEGKVQQRTKEIESARQRIEQQARDIRDSINYARSIQNALLPSSNEVKHHFPHSFVLFLPRDVVSGDFYWVAEKGSKRYLAVADCTGHGVPGALVSVLCVEKLEQALLLADDPGRILQIVSNEVKRTLRQSTESAVNASRDGMDVALIAYDRDTGTVSYSGAKRPLWRIRGGALMELPPTRFSIGGHSPDGQTFEEHRFTVQTGDVIYLFSDGIADQFGGPLGRKMTTGRFRERIVSCSHLPLERQQRSLLTMFQEWQGKEDQVDDVLVMGLRF